MFTYVAFAIIIIISYFLSCLITSIWNKIFLYFGEKSKHYEQIIGIALLILFLAFATLPVVIGPSFLKIEKVTNQEIGIDEPYLYDVTMEETKVKSSFIFPVMYKLPRIAICLYDADSQTALHRSQTYEVENSKISGGDSKYPQSKVVSINPFSEVKIRLTLSGGSQGFDEKEKYDEVLIFYNVRETSITFCSDIKNKDLSGATRIRINKEESGIQEGSCLKEGEINTEPYTYTTGHFCCPGLNEVDYYVLRQNEEGEVICIGKNMSGREIASYGFPDWKRKTICVDCNGECGKGEDWCICPHDCENPDTKEAIMAEMNEFNLKSANYRQENLSSFYKRIEELGGTNLVVHQSGSGYPFCAYVSLYKDRNEYYCIENPGYVYGVKTTIDPGQQGYCDGNTFICPPGLRK